MVLASAIKSIGQSDRAAVRINVGPFSGYTASNNEQFGSDLIDRNVSVYVGAAKLGALTSSGGGCVRES